MQREREKINYQKRALGTNLAERKRSLMDKVSSILSSGHFKTKEDIYRKVFNNEELQILGYGMNKMNKTINSNKTLVPKKRESSRQSLHENKIEEGFFLTQGNTINKDDKNNNNNNDE